MTLGKKLLQLRERDKISATKVAKAIGISPPHLFQLETDQYKNPSLRLCILLAKYYQVTLDYLVLDEGPEMARNEWLIEGMARLDLSEEMLQSLLTFAREISEV